MSNETKTQRGWNDYVLTPMGAIKMSDVYKDLAIPLPLMSDPDATVMSQLNHILYLQSTICLECKGIMEMQSKEANFDVYAQQQTVLNSLFVQHMELSIKATKLISAEQDTLGVSASSTESTEQEGVQLSARTLSEPHAEDGVQLIERLVGRTLSCEPYVDE